MRRKTRSANFLVEELSFNHQIPFIQEFFIDLLNLTKQAFANKKKISDGHETHLVRLLASLETAIAIQYKLSKDKESETVPPLCIVSEKHFQRKWKELVENEKRILQTPSQALSEMTTYVEAETIEEDEDEDERSETNEEEDEAAKQEAYYQGLAKKSWQSKITDLCPEFYPVYRHAKNIAAKSWGRDNFSGYIKTLMTSKYTEDDLARALSDVSQTVNLQGHNLKHFRHAVNVFQTVAEDAKESARKMGRQFHEMSVQLELQQSRWEEEKSRWEEEKSTFISFMRSSSHNNSFNSTVSSQADSNRLSAKEQKQVNACKNILSKNLQKDRHECIEAILTLLKDEPDDDLEELLEKLLLVNMTTEEEDTTVESWLSDHQNTDVSITEALKNYKELEPLAMEKSPGQHYQVISILYKYGTYFPKDPIRAATFHQYRTNPPTPQDCAVTNTM